MSLRIEIDRRESAIATMTAEWAGLIARGDFLTPGELTRKSQLWRGIQHRQADLRRLRPEQARQDYQRRQRAAELIRQARDERNRVPA
jgi:hypothetical protein